MAQTKEGLIQELIRDGYLKTPPIIEAFKKIDRKDFIPYELQGEAYGNYPLSIGEGQTISQPLTVAFILELLQPKPGEKILDVGSGSGWTAALLAHIVSQKRGSTKSEALNSKPSPLVLAIERIPELYRFGENNIRKYSFINEGIIKYFCGDASRMVPKELLPVGGFDKILSGAAAQKEIPEEWKKQLKVGGRIVAPVDDGVIVLDKISDEEFRAKEYFGFSFVPLISN